MATRSDLPAAARQPGHAQGSVRPCGVAKTNSPTMLSAGSTLNVTWTETVDHQGCFIFDLSTDNDVTWQPLAVVKHKTMPATPRPYTAQVQIPSTATCTNCTFRMRQIMYGSTLTLVRPPASRRVQRTIRAPTSR